MKLQVIEGITSKKQSRQGNRNEDDEGGETPLIRSGTASSAQDMDPDIPNLKIPQVSTLLNSIEMTSDQRNQHEKAAAAQLNSFRSGNFSSKQIGIDLNINQIFSDFKHDDAAPDTVKVDDYNQTIRLDQKDNFTTMRHQAWTGTGPLGAKDRQRRANHSISIAYENQYVKNSREILTSAVKNQNLDHTKVSTAFNQAMQFTKQDLINKYYMPMKVHDHLSNKAPSDFKRYIESLEKGFSDDKTLLSTNKKSLQTAYMQRKDQKYQSQQSLRHRQNQTYLMQNQYTHQNRDVLNSIQLNASQIRPTESRQLNQRVGSKSQISYIDISRNLTQQSQQSRRVSDTIRQQQATKLPSPKRVLEPDITIETKSGMFNEKMEKVYEEDERDREVQIKETNADIQGVFNTSQTERSSPNMRPADKQHQDEQEDEVKMNKQQKLLSELTQTEHVVGGAESQRHAIDTLGQETTFQSKLASGDYSYKNMAYGDTGTNGSNSQAAKNQSSKYTLKQNETTAMNSALYSQYTFNMSEKSTRALLGNDKQLQKQVDQFNNFQKTGVSFHKAKGNTNYELMIPPSQQFDNRQKMIKTAQGKYRATVKDIQQSQMDLESGGKSYTNLVEKQSKKSSKQTVFSKYGPNIFGVKQDNHTQSSYNATAGFGAAQNSADDENLFKEQDNFPRHSSMHLYASTDQNSKSTYFLELFHQKNQINSKLLNKQTSQQHIRDQNYQVKFQKWLKQNVHKKNDTLNLLRKSTSPRKGPIITIIKNTEYNQDEIGQAFKQNFKKQNPNPNQYFLRRQQKREQYNKSQIFDAKENPLNSVMNSSSNQTMHASQMELGRAKTSMQGTYSTEIRQLYRPNNRTISLGYASMDRMEPNDTQPAHAERGITNSTSADHFRKFNHISYNMDTNRPERQDVPELPYKIQYIQDPKERQSRLSIGSLELKQRNRSRESSMPIAPSQQHQINMIPKDFYGQTSSFGQQISERDRPYQLAQCVRKDIEQQHVRPMEGSKDVYRDSLIHDQGPMQLKLSMMEKMVQKNKNILMEEQTGRKSSHQDATSNQVAQTLRSIGISKRTQSKEEQFRLRAKSRGNTSQNVKRSRKQGKSLIDAISWGQQDLILNSNDQVNTFTSFRTHEITGRMEQDGLQAKEQSVIVQEEVKNEHKSPNRFNELFRILDKEIEQRPLRSRAQVIGQAILFEKKDIDDALTALDSYLSNKLTRQEKNRNYAMGKLESVLEEALQDKEEMEQNFEKSLKRSNKKDKGKKRGIEVPADQKDIFQLSTIQNASIEAQQMYVKQVQDQLQELEEITLDGNAEKEKITKEFMQLMHFIAAIKNHPDKKVSQEQAIKMVLEEQAKRKVKEEKSQRRLSASIQALQLNKMQLSLNLQNMKKLPPPKKDLTYEQATNPMNKLYKRELKKEMNPPDESIPVVSSLDKSMSFVPAGEHAKSQIEQMAHLKFDYRNTYKLQKLKNEQHKISEQKRLKQELLQKNRDRRALTKSRLQQNQKNEEEEEDDDEEKKSSYSSDDEKQEEKIDQKLTEPRRRHQAQQSIVDKVQDEIGGQYSHSKEEVEKKMKSIQLNLGMAKVQAQAPKQKSKKLTHEQLISGKLTFQITSKYDDSVEKLERREQRRQRRQKQKLKEVNSQDSQGSDMAGSEEYDEEDTEQNEGSSECEEFDMERKNMCKRQKVKAKDMSGLMQQSIEGKLQQTQEQALEIGHRCLKKELQKIYNASFQIVGRIMSAREKKILGEDDQKDQIMNQEEAQKTSRKDTEKKERIEMYDDIEVEKNVTDIIKKGENRVMENEDQAQPNFSADIIEYSKECKNTGVAPIPKILKLIQDNCLLIKGYNLFSHSTALAKFLSQTQEKKYFIKTLSLSDCCLKDEGIANLLKACIDQDFLEHITLAKDEIGRNTIDVLRHIMLLEQEMRLTKTLSQISFDQLQISEQNKREMLEVVSNFQNLHKVRISGINLSDKNVFKQLSSFIQETSFLSSLATLDISGANLKPEQLSLISKELITNKHIQHLNLSQNFMSDKDREAIILDESGAHPQVQPGKKPAMTKVNDEVNFYNNMIEFIKSDLNLIHLDLSNMNLSPNCLFQLLKHGIDKSESLLCFHISNNKIDRSVQNILDRLAVNSQVLKRNNLTNYANDYDQFIDTYDKQAKPSEYIHFLKQNQYESNLFVKKLSPLQRMFSKRKVQTESTNMQFLVNYSVNKSTANQIQQNQQQHFENYGRNQLGQDEHIYTRKIGACEIVQNKGYSNIPGERKQMDLSSINEFQVNSSAYWVGEQTDKDCYICSRSSMVYIFYSRRYATKDFQLVTNPETLTNLNKYYGLAEYAKKSKTPLILGSNTKWQSYKMIRPLYLTMLRLTKQIEKQPTAFLQNTEEPESVDASNDVSPSLKPEKSIQQKHEVLEHTIQKIRELIAANLNNPNKACGIFSDQNLSYTLSGWSCYFYEQIDQIIRNQEAQIFNFSSHHNNQTYLESCYKDKALELVYTKIMNQIQWYALAKRKRTHLDNSSDEDEDSVYPEIEGEGKDPKALHHFQQYHAKQPIFDPKKFEKDLQDTFVFGDFATPGLHTILIYDPLDNKVYYQQVLVQVRAQEAELTSDFRMTQTWKDTFTGGLANCERDVRGDVFTEETQNTFDTRALDSRL